MTIAGSLVLSTIVAIIPIVVLLVLLAGVRVAVGVPRGVGHLLPST